MGDLYLVCGIPGSGKSTWLKNHVKPGNVVISRDKIRFSLLQEGENYFAHEDEVYTILWGEMNKALKEGKNVFVDQTSLTPRSRKYLIDHAKNYDHVNIVWIKVPLETALERNENRKGTLAYVPREQIRRMDMQFVEPTFDEGFNRIFKYEDDKMTEKERK